MTLQDHAIKRYCEILEGSSSKEANEKDNYENIYDSSCESPFKGRCKNRSKYLRKEASIWLLKYSNKIPTIK